MLANYNIADKICDLAYSSRCMFIGLRTSLLLDVQLPLHALIKMLEYADSASAVLIFYAMRSFASEIDIESLESIYYSSTFNEKVELSKLLLDVLKTSQWRELPSDIAGEIACMEDLLPNH